MNDPSLAQQLAAAHKRIIEARAKAYRKQVPTKRSKDIEAKASLRRGLKGVFS